MTRTRALCLLPLLMTVGCQFTQDLGGPVDRAALHGEGGGSAVGTGVGGSVHTPLPLTDLEYPMGLWVRDGKIYFTEAAATATVYGGVARLSSYDPATNVRTTLVENPVNHDAVVVASDGKIYLAGWSGSIPGNSGHVSVVDPVTLVESPLAELGAAAGDMFIDDEDNLYVSGSGLDDGVAIYRLPAGDYGHPAPFLEEPHTTSAITATGGDFYFFSWGISRFRQGEPIEKEWVPEDPSWFSISALTVGSERLFYGGERCSDGYVPGYGQCPAERVGQIRQVALPTGGAFTMVADGLGPVSNVRFDPATGRLYVLEYGTEAGHYKDGRLLIVDPSP